MLRVVLVLVPGGDENRARVLDTVDIVSESGIEVEVADYLINGKWRIAHRRANGARVLAAKALTAVHTHTHHLIAEHVSLGDTPHQLTIDEVPDA